MDQSWRDATGFFNPQAWVPIMAATATARSALFAPASPAELREAILPEDVPQFDHSYREALDAAARRCAWTI